MCSSDLGKLREHFIEEVVHLLECEARNVSLGGIESRKPVKILVNEETELCNSRHRAAGTRVLREKSLG